MREVLGNRRGIELVIFVLEIDLSSDGVNDSLLGF